jgi:P pilus assembly chaperone PapD
MTAFRKTILAVVSTLAAIAVPLTAAHAELVLSQLIVELAPGDHSRADIEAWNNGPNRIFVAIDPREILAPGTGTQSSRSDPDPDKLGLLVSPARMILEPGQRKLIRVSSIAAGARERVYRVTVKPVVGQLASEQSGLKVLVGYDVLVLVRPSQPSPHVTGTRANGELTMRNDGNVSVELVDGRQCDATMKICEKLPEGRLYAGAQKSVKVTPGNRAEYKVKVGTKLMTVEF